MRVLVIGGTGFIGPYVVRELDALGHEVTIFHRGSREPSLPSSVRHVHGRFDELDRHVVELSALRPHVVVEMFAMTRPDVARMRALAGVAERAVVVSSADVYLAFGRGHRTEPGPPVPTPLSEDSPLRARVIDPSYDKVAVEEEARADPALPAAVVRAPATFGPGDPLHRLAHYLRRMDDGRPAIVVDEALRGWRWARGYVEDVAHAIALCAADPRSAGRTYNVAYERTYTEAEWIGELARVHGWRGEVVVAPSAELPESMRAGFDTTQDYAIDSSRIRRELGYAELVPFDEALRRAIEWERANPREAQPDDVRYEEEDAVLAARR